MAIAGEMLLADYMRSVLAESPAPREPVSVGVLGSWGFGAWGRFLDVYVAAGRKAL